MIIRRDFDSLDEAALVAFLDQPMIFYGHESEFGDRLAMIESVAQAVNRVGDVQWSDLATISRSNYTTFHDGETMRVVPFARRIDVAVPVGTSRLVIESLLRPSAGEPVEVGRRNGDAMSLGDSLASAITLAPGAPTSFRLTLSNVNAIDPEAVPEPRLPRRARASTAHRGTRPDARLRLTERQEPERRGGYAWAWPAST